MFVFFSINQKISKNQEMEGTYRCSLWDILLPLLLPLLFRDPEASSQFGGV